MPISGWSFLLFEARRKQHAKSFFWGRGYFQVGKPHDLVLRGIQAPLGEPVGNHPFTPKMFAPSSGRTATEWMDFCGCKPLHIWLAALSMRKLNLNNVWHFWVMHFQFWSHVRFPWGLDHDIFWLILWTQGTLRYLEWPTLMWRACANALPSTPSSSRQLLHCPAACWFRMVALNVVCHGEKYQARRWKMTKCLAVILETCSSCFK